MRIVLLQMLGAGETQSVGTGVTVLAVVDENWPSVVGHERPAGIANFGSRGRSCEEPSRQQQKKDESCHESIFRCESLGYCDPGHSEGQKSRCANPYRRVDVT